MGDIGKITMGQAKQDIELVKSSGYVTICDTTEGVIDIYGEDDKFHAYNSMNEPLTELMTEEAMVVWLAGKYTIERTK